MSITSFLGFKTETFQEELARLEAEGSQQAPIETQDRQRDMRALMDAAPRFAIPEGKSPAQKHIDALALRMQNGEELSARVDKGIGAVIVGGMAFVLTEEALHAVAYAIGGPYGVLTVLALQAIAYGTTAVMFGEEKEPPKDKTKGVMDETKAEAAPETPVYSSMDEWLKSPECEAIRRGVEDLVPGLDDDDHGVRVATQKKADALAAGATQKIFPLPIPSRSAEVNSRMSLAARGAKNRLPPLQYTDVRVLLKDLKTYWKYPFIMDDKLADEITRNMTAKPFRVKPYPDNLAEQTVNDFCAAMKLTLRVVPGGIALQRGRGPSGQFVEGQNGFGVYTHDQQNGGHFQVCLPDGEVGLHIFPGVKVDTHSARSLTMEVPPLAGPKLPRDTLSSAEGSRSQTLPPNFIHAKRRTASFDVMGMSEMGEAFVRRGGAVVEMGCQALAVSIGTECTVDVVPLYGAEHEKTTWPEEFAVQSMIRPNQYEYVFTDGTTEPAEIASIKLMKDNDRHLRVTLKPPKGRGVVAGVNVKGYTKWTMRHVTLQEPDVPDEPPVPSLLERVRNKFLGLMGK